MNNEIGTLQYLLNLESKNYRVIGVERLDNGQDLKVNLICKSCNQEIEVTLKADRSQDDEEVGSRRAKRVICGNCGKPEYLVTDTKDKVVRSFAIKGRRDFEKWKSGQENKGQ